ncbi:unnamed protein product [Thelazia callipaeda]|uniref:DUF19 domain-containing protein n=1 Tax=Thelazia callipaeda TaxID=103827 RepID=A0A0N5D847_THECL|nr:unnamed protein product [Thelazia callipaeda]
MSASQDEFAPPMCRILSSIRSDLQCVQKYPENDCSESALEVIGPLESETDHMYTQFTCDYVTNIAALAGSTNSPLGILSDDNIPYNVLYTFHEVDTICLTNVKSVAWKGIYDAICANQQQLSLQKQCFLNASNLVQCNKKPQNNTVCDALEQFSNNIDCALRVMVDVCTIEAQNVAVNVQDALNDNLIMNHCYKETTKDNALGDSGFKLEPKNPSCSSEQENLALACLVELVEVNRKITELNNVNFLNEISEDNSSIIFEICNLYQKYEMCINTTVFTRSGGKRCAFNSPLNSLARIGLSPICNEVTRSLFQKNQQCIQKVKQRTSICQSGLNSLGPAIHFMLQGIHGEAHLCNSFYRIRDAFSCGEKLFTETCTSEVASELREIGKWISMLGIEEGCPENPPSNMQEILTRSFADSSRKATKSHVEASSVPSMTCSVEKQKQFAACVQPITAFQPHPLAVIKQPKQIDEACKQFIKFKECQANISCVPLWAKGMTAMFNFACGSGYETYVRVRQCIRKTTTREDIRECVSEFSRGAPQVACRSSNKLLSCAIPLITNKCGEIGAKFVTDYIDKFATVIDPTCKILGEQSDKTVVSYNCTEEQTALIDHCAAPISDLTSRINELFEGGLQQFLSNVKDLAPVFARGCNLSTEFKQCLAPLLNTKNSEQCVVSSCLIRAGDGICDQSDTAKAIDDNLGCIFKQASEAEFGKCLRSTISTLKQFDLKALRSVLPQFVDCVEHIVVRRCGSTPINILRAISATEKCPILTDSEKELNKIEAEICSTEMERKHLDCVEKFYQTYQMQPITLINDPQSIDTLCLESSKLSNCSYLACEDDEQKAFNKLVDYICTRHEAYKKNSVCLTLVAHSLKSTKCIVDESAKDCFSLTNTANCAASHINDACGFEALTIQIPIATLKTNCSETDIIEYLQCENFIDRFSFTPLSFIRNSSQWDQFCAAINGYENCVNKMQCHVEPVSSANTALFKTICGKEKLKTSEYLPCLSQFHASQVGKSCYEPFISFDLIAKDSPKRICASIRNMLSCASVSLSSQCGKDALHHLIRMLEIWLLKFDKGCTITDFLSTKETKIDELSIDSKPTQIPIDEIADDQTQTSLSNLSSKSTANSKISEASNEESTYIGEHTSIMPSSPYSIHNSITNLPSVTTSVANFSKSSDSSPLPASKATTATTDTDMKQRMRGSAQMYQFSSALLVLVIILNTISV